MKSLSNELGSQSFYEDFLSKLLEIILEVPLEGVKEKRDLNNYIYTVLKNKQKKLGRMNGRERSITLNIIKSTDFNEYEYMEVFNTCKSEFIKKLMRSLTKKQYEVIEMKFFQNYKEKEIAKIIDISENAVSKRINKGLKKMKNILNEVRKEELVNGN